MSNRCGHNRKRLRLCDTVRRGQGGQPRVLGIISAYLTNAATNPGRLQAWQYHHRGLRRRRRSEAREATIATLQFLVANWLQLETRRCAMPGMDYMETPDVHYMARAISRSPDWSGSRLSPGRIFAALRSLVDAGYVTRSEQPKEQYRDGCWRAGPKITTFTRKFFQDLGGKRLWRLVVKSGRLKLEKMKHRLQAAVAIPGEDIRQVLGRYLNPDGVVTPRVARWLRQLRPPDAPPDRPHLVRKPEFAKGPSKAPGRLLPRNLP